MTYTYAVLEVSPAARAEIKAKLSAAGYQHAIDGDTIDMHGIALEPETETTEQKESRRRRCHPAVRQPDPEPLIGTMSE